MNWKQMFSPSRLGRLLCCQATRLTFGQRHAWQICRTGPGGTLVQLHVCSLFVGVTSIDQISTGLLPKPRTKKIRRGRWGFVSSKQGIGCLMPIFARQEFDEQGESSQIKLFLLTFTLRLRATYGSSWVAPGKLQGGLSIDGNALAI